MHTVFHTIEMFRKSRAEHMTLKDFILCQLRELKREVLNTMTGISQQDLCKVSPFSPHPIGWLILHCMSVIDYTIVRHVTGQQLFHYPTKLSKYPIDPPIQDEEMPNLNTLRANWTGLLSHTIRCLIQLDDQKLSQQSSTGIEPLVQSCLRAINHTNTHLRGIWCILTHAVTDSRWPTQPTWMEDSAIVELKAELEILLRSGRLPSQWVAELASRYAPRILARDNRAALDCCEDLIESCQEPYQTIAILLIESMHDRLTMQDFSTLERWLDQYIASADICDNFCDRILQPMIERQPMPSSLFRDWVNSPNAMVIRAAMRLMNSERNGA